MGLVAEIERLLDRIEQGDRSARLAPEASDGQEEIARRLNALFETVQEAQAWREVYPRELALARDRYEELLRVLSALRRLSDVLCSARTPEDICSWAASVLAEELEFEHCSVLLYDRPNDQLIEVASSERKPAGADPRFSARLGALGQAFRERRPTLVFPAKKGRSGFLALAPLRAGEERLGLIRLARPLKGVPTSHIEHGLVLLSAIAAQMLKIVELKRRLSELNQGLGRELERQAAVLKRRAEEVEQLEGLLSELMELSGQPVFVVGASGRLLRVNAAAEQLLGQPAATVLGHRFSRFLAPGGRREAVAALLAGLRSGEATGISLAVQGVSGQTVSLDVSLRVTGGAEGGGVCVAIARPAEAVACLNDAPVRRPARRTAARAKRLLIIDDEVHLLESLKELLSACDHDVTVAASATEGLARAEAEEFDLILTDLSMPEMNGCQVAERIKASRPQTPVGLMTGWGSGEPPEELKAHGVDFVLRKPFDIQEILDYLKTSSSH